MSINAKIFMLLLVALFTAIAFTLVTSTLISKKALLETNYHNLATLRDIKKREIEKRFNDLYVDVSAMSQNIVVSEFSQSLLTLQNEKVPFDTVRAGEIAEKYANQLERLTHAYRYSELFLLDTKDARILYSTRDGMTGEKLTHSHKRQHIFLTTWEETLAKQRTTLTDMHICPLGGDTPVMHIATPVYRDGRPIAVMVLQLTAKTLRSMITFGDVQLLPTQELYLVGPDRLLRSDTRLDTIHHTVNASFTNPKDGKVDTSSVTEGLHGNDGTHIITDYRGIKVLSSFTPVHIAENIQWVLLAEIDETEILRAPRQIGNIIMILSLILFPVLLAVTYMVLRKGLIEPLNLFMEKIVRLAKHPDRQLRITGSFSPEIDRIAESFNLMLGALEETENQLEQSAIYLQKGQEISGIGIWANDLKEGTLFWSPNTFAIFGVTPKSFTPTYEAFLQMIPESDRFHVRKTYETSLANRSDYQVEHRIIRGDGSNGIVEERCRHLYDERGKPVRSIGTIIDLTERKKMELELKNLNLYLEQKVKEKTRQLEASLERFTDLFNLTLEAIIIHKEGVTIDVNRAGAEMFGYKTRSDIIGKNIMEYIAEESKPIIMRYIREEHSPIYEARLIRNDGSTFPVLVKGRNMHTDEGVLRVTTILDISEIKEKEKQLIIQSRHAIMGEMLAMIAHQWRQPLTSISATTATLQFKCAMHEYDQAFFESQLKKITEYVQHLSTTIDDFRGFFKETKQISRVQIDTLTRHALSLMQNGLQSHGITLVEHYDSSEAVESYANELLQVILNLVKNAEEALHDSRTPDPQITVRTYSDRHSVCIEVSDNAGGVPDTVKDRIFEAYFTTKEEVNGTGLGLYMSKIIVEKHCHGTLSLINADEGARFVITLSKRKPHE